MFKPGLSLLFCCTFILASSRVCNFSAVNKVNTIVFNNDNAYVLTAGGLFTQNLKNGSSSQTYGSLEFPDPDLTASAVDRSGNLWVGSDFGYLAVYNGKWERLSTSYQAAGWKIRALYPYGDYLFVGTSLGLSVFDTKKQRAEKSATAFSTLTTADVTAMIVYNDNLYVGTNEGVVRLDNISKKLKDYNFYFPAIWIIDSSFSGAVKSFGVENGTLKAYQTLSQLYNGKVYTDSASKLVQGSDTVARFPSKITSLTAQGGYLWIGTEYDYYYRWNGQTVDHFTIPGPVFKSVNAVIVDKNQNLWAIPTGSLQDELPWNGFHQFNGEQWSIHNTKKYPGMGPMPGNPESGGLTVSRDGAIWFSTAGAHLKRYIPSTQNWSQFCTYSKGGSNGHFYHDSDCPIEKWAKTDAVVQDSSGFMWIGCWENPDGPLICYDPRYEPDYSKQGTPEAHYRRFFPSGDPNNCKNVSCMNVDYTGRILVGADAQLMVLKHKGNPVRDSIQIERVIGGTGEIRDMSSTTSGVTYLVTLGMGLCKYTPGDSKVVTISDISDGINAVEVEDEDYVWFASPKDGLIRYNFATKEKTVFNQVNGLIGSRINSLAIDKVSGYVYAATDVGITRLALGFTTSSSGPSEICVFPIPFSKSKHSVMNFQNIPKESTVSVYSVTGQIVGIAKPVLSNVSTAYYTWTVPGSLSPGTYYYAVKSKNDSRNGKFLIVP